MALRYGAPISKTYVHAAHYIPHERPLSSKSPYDINDDDKDRFLKSAYTGHVPFIGESCGHSSSKLTSDAISKFREGRSFRRPHPADHRITEYDIGKAPPIPRSPRQIPEKKQTEVNVKKFPVTLGLPTTYRGHVQGLKGIVGMTMGMPR